MFATPVSVRLIRRHISTASVVLARAAAAGPRNTRKIIAPSPRPRSTKPSIPSAVPSVLDASTSSSPTEALDASGEADSSSHSSLLPSSSLPSTIEVPADPAGILDLSVTSDGARTLLSAPALVIARQIEMMNIFLGFEQANKYQILNPAGDLVGYLMEEETGVKGTVVRQLLRRRRPFTATVLGLNGERLLTIRRPFSLINSKIYIDVEGVEIGEVQQTWHLYKRRYDYYLNRSDGMQQFGATDEGLMAWDFRVKNEVGEVCASVNRDFTGFARELFTDTGQYVVRFEGVDQNAFPAPESVALPLPTALSTPALPTYHNSVSAPAPASSSGTTDLIPLSVPQLTYDQRAVVLASAISIDFDYFSRMSSSGGMGGMGFMPIWMPGMGGGGGGGSAEGGEVAEEPAAATGSGDLAGGSGGYNDGSADTRDSGDYNSSSSGGSNDYGDESMDPGDSGGEDGGTWGWSDLFDGDD